MSYLNNYTVWQDMKPQVLAGLRPEYEPLAQGISMASSFPLNVGVTPEVLSQEERMDKLCRIYKLYVDDYDASNRSLLKLNYLEYLPHFPFLSLYCSREALDMNSLLHLNLLLFSSACWKESKAGDI